MERFRYTKKERSWILYDVANSAFVLLATAIIPVYFKSLADGPALTAWSYAETTGSLLLALFMPILGSIADLAGMKAKFLLGTVLTGVVATICLGFPTNATIFLVIYIVASLMVNSSMVFYDALLVDATTDERMDKVSSSGYAWGYIGSVVPFIVSLLVVLKKDMFGLELQTAMQIAFTITALWWLAFTIPVLKNVKQIHFKPSNGNPFKGCVSGVFKTIVTMFKHAALRPYMIAYFFYIDGVHTIIKLSTSYGADLGIDSTQMLLALLVTQFVAFPAAIIYGSLSKRYGTKTMIMVGIAGYTGITLFASFFLNSAVEFWILAILVGLFQGGIQALSRSEFAKLCPKDHANEYFGIFDIFGKYSSILGTFIVGTISALTGNGSLGVGALVVLFALGLYFMSKVPSTHTSSQSA